MSRSVAAFTALGAMLAIPTLAQPPSPSAVAPPQELYHLHFAKAAAGKLAELTEANKGGPAPDKGDPQVAPIILRHREGGEWDLFVITPLGKEHTMRTDVPLPQDVQQFNQRVNPLTDWHSDSFVVGPTWDVVQKALMPSAGAQSTVYTVSDYRAVPGHRPQLRQTLDALAQQAPGRGVLFAHAEGGPWNFIDVVRYDSWGDLGRQATQPAPAASQPDPGLQLREHMAVHHDTVATYVAGGEARK